MADLSNLSAPPAAADFGAAPLRTVAAPAPAATLPAAFRGYALVLLMAIYTLNFLDRQVVNILVEKIKADLHLYDWQIGMLTGFSFALLYTMLGIPVARAADPATGR